MWTATGSRKISVKDMIWIRFKQEHHKWKWAPRALVFQEILRNLFGEALLSQNRWIRLFLEGKIIANLWGPVDVCAFWHRFTVKYSLNIKENLQYKCLIREWPQAVFFPDFFGNAWFALGCVCAPPFCQHNFQLFLKNYGFKDYCAIHHPFFFNG